MTEDPVVVTEEITIRHGVNDEGEMAYTVRVSGDSLLTTYLGLLRLAERELLREFLGEDG